MPSPDLKEKVIVITGASSGIGRASALAFAARGARVVLAARNRAALEAVAAECRAHGAHAMPVPTDVTDAAAVRKLAQAAVQAYGQIDVWINNVGVGAVGRFDQTPLESHRRVIETNLMGHLHGAHAVIPHFRLRGRGTLINMISLGGFVPSPYASAYSASKFGIRGLSEALRAELSDLPSVHVCEVYPTFVDTPGMSHGANYTGHGVKPPPPLVDPRRVAAALVSLARFPRPAVDIGSVAWPARLAHAVAPNLCGSVMNRVITRAVAKAPPVNAHDGNLFEPTKSPAVDGGYRHSKGAVPFFAGAAVLAAAVALYALGRMSPPSRWPDARR